ncbi:MAG: ribosome biogenesis GTP-binding protein YihA/YsxC [Bacteroidota bacterium]|nr:ribosome biogenesis GTP-binding protein YihA/YsxC [Bacteroidota bacterium]
MIIRSASFIGSSPSIRTCPAPVKPEFGFIGRSNVGKSSLINFLTGRRGLAKISGEPGRTRTINHFLINNSWYLVDLPGYGFAKAPIKIREAWMRNVREYILKRENLACLFVLLDSRLNPQSSDLSFMEFLGRNQIPFARVFTKSDKVIPDFLEKAILKYNNEMLFIWGSLPHTFISSTVRKTGRQEILDFIGETINNLSNPV